MLTKSVDIRPAGLFAFCMSALLQHRGSQSPLRPAPRLCASAVGSSFEAVDRTQRRGDAEQDAEESTQAATNERLPQKPAGERSSRRRTDHRAIPRALSPTAFEAAQLIKPPASRGVSDLLKNEDCCIWSIERRYIGIENLVYAGSIHCGHWPARRQSRQKLYICFRCRSLMI